MEECFQALRKRHGSDVRVVVLFDSIERIRGTSLNADEVAASVELARQLTAAATPLMQSVTRMRFASGKRREALRLRARTQTEQVLALVHIVDAHRYLQPFPGHRDELIARARHLIVQLDRARQAPRRPEP